jgi:hypothetical protein
MKLHAYYLDWMPALHAMDEAFQLLGAFAGQVVEMELRFFAAIVLLGSLQQASPTQQAQRKQKALEQAEFLERWARDCPANFSSMATLVQAELLRIDAKPLLAAKTYALAAEQAQANHFLQHLALALELAARHQSQQGTDASAAMERAALAYESWGASAKAQHLRQIVRI